MISFKDNFPSLNRIHVCKAGGLFNDKPNDFSVNYVPISDVKDYCLDKQKVREAIEISYVYTDPSGNEVIHMDKLLKELGLDKEEKE